MEREKSSSLSMYGSLAICLSILFFASAAFGENFYVVPGSGRSIDVTASSGDKVLVELVFGYSYECEIRQPKAGENDEVLLFSPTISTPGSSVTVDRSSRYNVRVATSDSPRIRIPGSMEEGKGFGRIAINAVQGGTYTLELIGLKENDGTADLNISCVRTTLFGSFNTFTADVVIVEVMNTSDNSSVTPVTVSLSLGGPVAQRFDVLNGSGRLDFVFNRTDLTDVFGTALDPNTVVGQVIVHHMGGRDSVRAQVSQYKISNEGALELISTLPCEQH